MQYYFVKNIINNKPIFYEQDLIHMFKVLRYRINQEIIIVFENKKFLTQITNNKNYEFKILKEIFENNEYNQKINIFIPLIKRSNLELAVQKACELSASNIYITKYHYSNQTYNNIDRLNYILKEASEQSRRNRIPNLYFIDFDEALDIESDLKIYCHNYSSNTKLVNEQNINSINLFIGPEAGFHLDEINKMNSLGFHSLLLTKTVLKAETACISALSLLRSIYGR